MAVEQIENEKKSGKTSDNKSAEKAAALDDQKEEKTDQSTS